MAGTQRLSDEKLKQLEDHLEHKFQSIRTQVDRLNKVIDSVEGGWKGIGAGAFNQKQRQINDDLTALGRILSGFTDSIHDTRTLSGNTEDDVAQRMNRLEAGGGLASGGGPDTQQGSVANAYGSKLSQM